MNMPKNFAIQKDGIIFYSNRMPTEYGVHSYISEDGTVKVERITDCRAAFKGAKKHKTRRVSYTSILLITFSLFILFLQMEAFQLLPIPVFLFFDAEYFFPLCKKFKLRTKRHHFKLAFQRVYTLCQMYQEIPYLADLKMQNDEEYQIELEHTVFYLFLTAGFTLLSYYDSHYYFDLITYIIAVCFIHVICRIITGILKEINLTWYLRRFFVSQLSEADMEVILDGLTEWENWEEEISCIY